MNKEWFKLENVEIDASRYNNFASLKENKKHADMIKKDSWNNEYVKISAKLTFMGKLNTPNGEVDTQFDYYIQTTYKDMLKEAKITIYEQTFTGLDEAVTIRFSSGSIISKIVFGDIEKCYQMLKEEVSNKIKEYNDEVEKFNIEIDEMIKKENKDGEE